MLADLVLTDLPIEVLIALKKAINDEILHRKKFNYVQRRLQNLEKTKITPISTSLEFKEAIDALIQLNHGYLLTLPGHAFRQHFRDRIRYLPCILVQDWHHLFPNIQNEDTSYYVYAHLDPRVGPVRLYGLDVVLHGAPFYIGKGTGKRAWDLKRTEGHRKKIKQIRDAGFPDTSIMQVIVDSLGERDALILEAKLIYLFGSIYDESLNGCLFNLADSTKPCFTGFMQKLPNRDTYEKIRIKQQELLNEGIALTLNAGDS